MLRNKETKTNFPHHPPSFQAQFPSFIPDFSTSSLPLLAQVGWRTRSGGQLLSDSPSASQFSPASVWVLPTSSIPLQPVTVWNFHGLKQNLLKHGLLSTGHSSCQEPAPAWLLPMGCSFLQNITTCSGMGFSMGCWSADICSEVVFSTGCSTSCRGVSAQHLEYLLSFCLLWSWGLQYCFSYIFWNIFSHRYHQIHWQAQLRLVVGLLWVVVSTTKTLLYNHLFTSSESHRFQKGFFFSRILHQTEHNCPQTKNAIRLLLFRYWIRELALSDNSRTFFYTYPSFRSCLKQEKW